MARDRRLPVFIGKMRGMSPWAPIKFNKCISFNPVDYDSVEELTAAMEQAVGKTSKRGMTRASVYGSVRSSGGRISAEKNIDKSVCFLCRNDYFV
jgi:hypothetical protein